MDTSVNLKQFFPGDILAILSALRIAYDAGRDKVEDAAIVAKAEGWHAALDAVARACQCEEEG